MDNNRSFKQSEKMGKTYVTVRLNKYIDNFEQYDILFSDIKTFLFDLEFEDRAIIQYRWRDEMSVEEVAKLFQTLTTTILKRENTAIKRLQKAARDVIKRKKEAALLKIADEAFNSGDKETYAKCLDEAAKL